MTTFRFGLALASVALVVGCYPTTTRPSFLPEPSAAVTEIQLSIPQATRALALALDADSIPVRRTEANDGWLETDWFDARTLKPTTRRRLGVDVVKVRAWIDPSRPSIAPDTVHSHMTVETVYRPLADPSRAERDLERQVPPEHPIAKRIAAITSQLVKIYGGEVTDSVVTVPLAAPAVPARPKLKGGGGR